MLKSSTLRELESLRGFDEMVRVIGMQSVLHTTKPVIREGEPQAFAEKCQRKFARLLGETPVSAERALALLMACEEFEQRQSFAGLGGCEVKSLKACLDCQPGAEAR